MADETGTACGNGQSGPVWFLAGTYGTRRTVRSCTVPGGKYLFFPLINYIVMPNAEAAITCEDAVSTAGSMTDAPFALVLELDGQKVLELAAFRQAPVKCFDAAVRRHGGVRVFPSAANGYYVMLSPLSAGKHVLNFGGVLPQMSQAVTYTLVIR